MLNITQLVKRAIAKLPFVLVLSLFMLLGLASPPAPAAPAQATVQWLTPETENSPYKKAERPISLKFPEDLGAHPDYQTEWWYYTGNLETPENRKFGYQFTIFRRAIAPQDPPPKVGQSSDWRSRQVYFAHFTLSDIENQQFYPQERFSRGAADLAGAEADPYHVWIDNWTMIGEDGSVHLKANGDEVKIDLNLEQSRPPVLQGDRGYSVKGPEPGNASYYYSIVQQPTHGTVTVKDQTFEVRGISWKDHEYSTSALSPGTAGWDWFSLQFEDQSALMVYILRQEDGTPLEFSRGSYIDPDGNVTALTKADWQLEVLNHWKSPDSGAKYPSEWKLSFPKLEISLQGKPLMPNQELNLSTVYWEGAVEFKGDRQNQPIRAQGYVELTGYKESLSSLRS